MTDYSIKEGGLSSRVVVLNSKGRPRMGVGARSVSDVLSKTSYFLDEYLGRAVQDARLDTLTQFNPRHRKELYQRLFSTSRRSGFFGGLLPKATEGLLPYMYKLKISLVAIPLLSTAIFACAFAKINNWLTERRFGGRKFFPGEGIPHDLAQEIEKRAFEGKPEPSKEVLA